MAHEIETKVLDVDANEMDKKLQALGAKKMSHTRLSVTWYGPAGSGVGNQPWYMRIRSNSEGKHQVTWKAKSEILGTARKHKEINFYIDEPEQLADLFEELGFSTYAYQEKDRTSYTLKDWVFDLDQYPGMPALLEIEGSSEDHVKEAIQMLGLESNKTWAHGERTLIEGEYKMDWCNMRFK
jgi:adenylate cyclase class 2